MKIIARIHSDFPEKFGIPRQSGIVPTLQAKIVFEPEYRNAEAVRGLEDFSHIWIIWQFSEAIRDDWSPTVRPPRLGGNKRMGVFATRSPFRPNPIGLSSVKLAKIEFNTGIGPVLYVEGADLMDGTPIYDIKPYLPYTDCHPEATGGFAIKPAEYELKVNFDENLLNQIAECQRESLIQVLSHDPRPTYQEDENRLYGMSFGQYEVKFRVSGKDLFVTEVQKRKE